MPFLETVPYCCYDAPYCRDSRIDTETMPYYLQCFTAFDAYQAVPDLRNDPENRWRRPSQGGGNSTPSARRIYPHSVQQYNSTVVRISQRRYEYSNWFDWEKFAKQHTTRGPTFLGLEAEIYRELPQQTLGQLDSRGGHGYLQ